MKPRVLLLGGIDPSGGAGLSADATVTALHGAMPLPIAVCLTVQNATGFRASHAVAVAQWRGALRAVLADGEPHAIKLGLLGDAATASVVAAELRSLAARVPIVVDPVLSATSGGWQPADELLRAYRDELLPLATLFTPNLPELGALCGGSVAAAAAAGARATLLKGGHAAGAWSEDELTVGASRWQFRRPRLAVGRVRGTGCALASAIAADLAHGLELPAACERAGDWLARLLASMGEASASAAPRQLPWTSVRPEPRA